MSSLSQEHNTAKWFLGFRQTGERDLTVSEIEAIRIHIRKLRRRPVLILALAIAILVLSFVLGEAVANKSQLMNNLAAVVLIVVIFMGLPVAILISRDSFKEADTLKRDLEVGLVFIFEGSVGEWQKSTKIYKGLLREGIPWPDTKINHRIDVLPLSAAIITVNGARPEGWWRGEVFEATSSPSAPYVVPASLDLEEETPDSPSEVFQRHMSHEEIDELRFHVKNMKTPPWFLITLIGWLLLALVSMIHHASQGQLGLWFRSYKWPLVILSVFLIINFYRYLSALRFVRLVDQDLNLGTLKILKTRTSHENAIEEECSAVSEILPVSHLIWSMDGAPSPWRFSKSYHAKK